MDDRKRDIWCPGNLWCPVTTTAQLIGRKWHPVIVFELLKAEPLGFYELKRTVDGVSNKVLSETLEDLDEKRIVDREVIDDNKKPLRWREAVCQPRDPRSSDGRSARDTPLSQPRKNQRL